MRYFLRGIRRKKCASINVSAETHFFQCVFRFFTDFGEKMYPIAFHIGSFAVHWYGVFIGIGFLVSFRLLLSLKKYAGLTTDQIYNISMIALFAGVFALGFAATSGATTYYWKGTANPELPAQ